MGETGDLPFASIFQWFCYRTAVALKVGVETPGGVARHREGGREMPSKKTNKLYLDIKPIIII